MRRAAGGAAGCPRWSTGSCPAAIGEGATCVVVDPWRALARSRARGGRRRPGRPRPCSAGRWLAGSPTRGRRPAPAAVGRPWVAEWQAAEDRAQAAIGRLLGRGPGATAPLDRAVAGPPAVRLAARPVPPWWCRPRCRSGTSSRSPAPAAATPGAGQPGRQRDRRRGVDRARGGPGRSGADGGPGRRSGLPPRRLGAGRRRRAVDAGLTVVVADNRGGGIFSFLEQAAALDAGHLRRRCSAPRRPPTWPRWPPGSGGRWTTWARRGPGGAGGGAGPPAGAAGPGR